MYGEKAPLLIEAMNGLEEKSKGGNTRALSVLLWVAFALKGVKEDEMTRELENRAKGIVERMIEEEGTLESVKERINETIVMYAEKYEDNLKKLKTLLDGLAEDSDLFPLNF